MIKYLKLIRLPNLLMVPVTMYLMRYFIIEPILQYYYSFNLGENITLQFDNSLFIILIVINVLLGASGYVINDYFDRKIDRINRPNKVLVGNSIHRRFAIILHFTLTGIAILLSTYLAYRLRQPFIIVVYAMIAGIFWFYSTTYKKQFLIGNLIVAMGTAMIPMQVVYFDIVSLNKAYGELLIMNGLTFKIIFLWVGAFALFAFLTNLLREIIKDIEDFEGDKSYGCNTIPVVAGIKTAKIFAVTLDAGIIWLLSYLYFNHLNDTLSLIYLSILVALPLLLVAILIIKANSVKQYHTISTLIKAIMLFGVLYSIVAHYIIVFNS